MEFFEWLKTLGGIASACSAIIALVLLVIRPIVKAVKKKRAAVKAKEEEEKAFRTEVKNALAAINQRLDGIESRQDLSEKEKIRSTIFRMAAECRRGEKHSLEEYRHIPELKKQYDELLAKTGDSNGVFNDDYTFIMDCYHRDLENNDFLN